MTKNTFSSHWHSPSFAVTALFGLLSLGFITTTQAAEPVKSVRIYTINCGEVNVSNMAPFSDTGEYDGKPGKVMAPCYLIRHPKGNLLWDTGLGDGLAEKKEGVDNGPFHMHLDKTLTSQLTEIEIEPADIQFVSFSHLHFDHTGNANLFTNATWLLSKKELDWGLSTPTPFGVNPDSFSAYKTVKIETVDADLDVFGDGTVKIFSAPGHTPGHKVLWVKLKKNGNVLLSGDLYHTIENRSMKRMPVFNVDRADTLASMDRIERIVKNTGARFVIQHAPESFAVMPKFPGYLD